MAAQTFYTVCYPSKTPSRLLGILSHSNGIKNKKQECSGLVSNREDLLGCKKAIVGPLLAGGIAEYSTQCVMGTGYFITHCWFLCLLLPYSCCSQFLRKRIYIGGSGFFIVCKKKILLRVTPHLRCSRVQPLGLKKGIGCDCVSVSLKLL